LAIIYLRKHKTPLSEGQTEKDNLNSGLGGCEHYFEMCFDVDWHDSQSRSYHQSSFYERVPPVYDAAGIYCDPIPAHVFEQPLEHD